MNRKLLFGLLMTVMFFSSIQVLATDTISDIDLDQTKLTTGSILYDIDTTFTLDASYTRIKIEYTFYVNSVAIADDTEYVNTYVASTQTSIDFDDFSVSSGIIVGSVLKVKIEITDQTTLVEIVEESETYTSAYANDVAVDSVDLPVFGSVRTDYLIVFSIAAFIGLAVVIIWLRNEKMI